MVKQLSLFEEDVEINGFRYTCYITTLTLSRADVWWLIEEDNCENCIKELKSDYLLDKMNQFGFDGTEASLLLRTIAYNFMSLFRQAIVNISYIFVERSRELLGEAHRWFDLVRTQKWAELAGAYEICDVFGSSTGDHIPVVVTRTIPSTAYLRPIPKTTINGLTALTVDEQAAYKNPGY